MRFRILCGLSRRPGISQSFEQAPVGILVDSVITAISLAKAKSEAMVIAEKNPVMYSAIRDQGTYHSPWLTESITEDNLSFWTRLYPHYCEGLAYVHVIQLPEEEIPEEDIDFEITEEWERDYKLLPKHLRKIYREKAQKAGHVVIPENASTYFISGDAANNKTKNKK